MAWKRFSTGSGDSADGGKARTMAVARRSITGITPRRGLPLVSRMCGHFGRHVERFRVLTVDQIPGTSQVSDALELLRGHDPTVASAASDGGVHRIGPSGAQGERADPLCKAPTRRTCNAALLSTRSGGSGWPITQSLSSSPPEPLMVSSSCSYRTPTRHPRQRQLRRARSMGL